MGTWAHLAGRFVGAHRPGGPSPADRAWVGTVLTPAELALWERQPDQDLRHTVEVARRVEALLAGTAHAGDSRWLACALLHDVGKVAARLGIYGRVLATVVAKTTRGQATAWEERWHGEAGPAAGVGAPGHTAMRRQPKSDRLSLRRRIALYLNHGEIGADMVRLVGGREEVALWAAAHHHQAILDPYALPGPVVHALAVSDPD